MVRSFNFDMVQRETADGRTRITEGAYWYNEAQKMARKGTAKLVMNSKSFAGYGRMGSLVRFWNSLFLRVVIVWLLFTRCRTSPTRESGSCSPTLLWNICPRDWNI